MLLTELLTPERVKVPLVGQSKDEVLRELVVLALPDADAPARAAILEALHDRERVLSTGIGDGVAIPHAKTPLIAQLIVAVGVAERPVEYDSLDGSPAELFFLLLGPESAAGAHLKTLSRISRLLRRESFRESLRAAPDGPALYALIADSERA